MRGGADEGGSAQATRVKLQSRTHSRFPGCKRQVNDPYVKGGEGARLAQPVGVQADRLDEKCLSSLLKTGRAPVFDLGVAPGGLSAGPCAACSRRPLVGIDLLPTDPIEGWRCEMDSWTGRSRQPDRGARQAPDLIPVPHAANTSRHAATDHLRTMGWSEAAGVVRDRDAEARLRICGQGVRRLQPAELLDTCQRNFATSNSQPARQPQGVDEMVC